MIATAVWVAVLALSRENPVLLEEIRSLRSSIAELRDQRGIGAADPSGSAPSD